MGSEIFDVHPMLLQGDFNHLFVRQGTGLQGQSIFRTKLTFRPHSTESFTHRKMTMSLADRSTKTQKVKVIPIAGNDPDAHREEMIKKEEERLRATIRRESQQRRIREKAHARGLNSSYLEGEGDDEDEDDTSISLSAIKKNYKPGAKRDRANIYSSDSDDDYDSEKEEKQNKKSLKAKKLESDEEDSGSDSAPKKKKARIVESDDENNAGSASQNEVSANENEDNDSS